MIFYQLYFSRPWKTDHKVTSLDWKHTYLLNITKMGISLIDVVASNDFFCKPLGISVRDKAYRQLSIRVYILLAFLWLDLVFAVAVAFVPNENAELLLKLGDLPFHVMNRNRYFMTGKLINALMRHIFYSCTLFPTRRGHLLPT